MHDSDFELLDRTVAAHYGFGFTVPTPSELRKRPTKRHPASRRGRNRNGEAFLCQPVRRSRITVLHPRIQTQGQRSWTMADYISVPRVSLRGEFNLGDMLNDDSIGNLLRVYNLLKRG